MTWTDWICAAVFLFAMVAFGDHWFAQFTQAYQERTKALLLVHDKTWETMP